MNRPALPGTGATSFAWLPLLRNVTLGCALVLITVRWFLPTEDAASGEQLGGAVAWMLVAVAWSLCGHLRHSATAIWPCCYSWEGTCWGESSCWVVAVSDASR